MPIVTANLEKAEKLHALARRYEDGSADLLTLNALGEIFGNDFWNLILYDAQSSALDRLTAAAERIAKSLEIYTRDL